MDSRPLAPLAQSEKATPTQPAAVTQSKKPAPVRQSSVPLEDIPREPGAAWGPETDTVATNEPVEKPTKEPVPSTPEIVDAQKVSESATNYQPAALAHSKAKLSTPEDLPEKSAAAAGDPLYTDQIDNGLNQLLTDWSLFKKSGLFGTGPKGTEHPLYLKIKDLQIPLLLTGRFEGATQEIKQSITDYMNGWRYEQGIVYSQGENFDHYLRRVIRHILDLHKKG
jgi:hypothetical protein